MFKGIVSIFTSGLFFHPMVLSGVIAAVIAMLRLSIDDIYGLFKNSYLYILALVWATIYTISLARVYKEGGEGIDISATILRAVGNTGRLLLAFVVTLSFVMLMSF